MGSLSIRLPSSRLGVVDATGAGDAFIAGFLSSWLSQPIPKHSDLEHKDILCISWEFLGNAAFLLCCMNDSCILDLLPPEALIDACAKGHAVASVCLGREGACVEPVRPRAPRLNETSEVRSYFVSIFKHPFHLPLQYPSVFGRLGMSWCDRPFVAYSCFLTSGSGVVNDS